MLHTNNITLYIYIHTHKYTHICRPAWFGFRPEKTCPWQGQGLLGQDLLQSRHVVAKVRRDLLHAELDYPAPLKLVPQA